MVGKVTSRQAWEALAGTQEAHLVDVRTTAEWSYVGLPDLTSIGKRVVLVSWQHFPSGEIDRAFAARLREAGLAPDRPLYFLCRSGARSQSAAEDAARHGFTHVYNVVDGFEGPPDARGRRGCVCGWKCEGLPWHQG